MDPKVFGPKWWFVIHSMAANATDDKKRAAYRHFMMDLLPILLPCAVCANHYKANVSKIPIDQFMSNHVDLLTWSWKLHDIVNVMLGQTSPPLSEVQKIYLPGQDSTCHSRCTVEEEDSHPAPPVATPPVRRAPTFYFPK